MGSRSRQWTGRGTQACLINMDAAQHPGHAAMSARFVDMHVFREDRFSIGHDSQTGEYFLSIPVANRMVDYEEYYRITPEQNERFADDVDAARAFADACRARQKDDALILQPGSDRGTAHQ